MIKKYYIKTR